MESNRILAFDQTVSNETRLTGLNNNDIIIGPSGSGKTRGYVIPNILQANESMVITDTKGSLRRKLSGVLEQEGYTVVDLDFTDCAASKWGYNPLRNIRKNSGESNEPDIGQEGYIMLEADFAPEDWAAYDPPEMSRENGGGYNEQDILTAAACLVPLRTDKEPFWDYAARMLLESLIAYVLECLPENEHTLSIVARLLQEMNEKYFRHLYEELGLINPESFAYSRFRMFYLAHSADKMVASIQGILAVALSPYMFRGGKALFDHPNQFCFEELGRRKTAVFLTVSDTDRSLDALVTLFYTQALQALCREADRQPGNRLAVPVRFILDDFAANTVIPDFDQITSVIRSREISVSLILQSLSQLNALYGTERAKTILNNCDHCLYLGGQDVETAYYVSKKANRPTSDILNMPLDASWLFTRGELPRQVRKYCPEDHPRCPNLG